MSARLRRVPPTGALQTALLAVVLVLLAEDAGQPLARWGLAALVVLVLAGVALAGVPPPVRPAPLVLVALGAFAAFTLWSYLSIFWADVPGDAWQGANRTLLYLLVLAVAAVWAPAGPGAMALTGAFAAGVALLGLLTLARLSGGASPDAFFASRLAFPAGYPNATASLWLLAAWPALVLASRRRVPWAARGAMAGAAALLLSLALMGQSRGAVFAFAAVVAAVAVALPQRVRLGSVMAVVVAAVAVAAPTLLDVGAALDAADEAITAPVVAALDAAVGAALLAAAAAAAAIGAWAWLERHRPPTRALGRVAHQLGRTVAVVAVGVGAALVVASGPVDRAGDAWRSFQGDYREDFEAGERLAGGLGSGRYDFWRVALDGFAAHPVRGEGMDQFRRRYLREGRSGEEARYPHSMPVAVLSQTGLVGAALLLLAFGTALAVALARMRTASRSAAATAAAAAAAFASWIAHSGVDWLWETAGLGAAACLLLGWAMGVRDRGGSTGRRLVARSPEELAAVGVWVVVLGVVLTPPWLADRQLARAGAAIARDPERALGHLERAAQLDPLSTTPATAEGTARLRLGDVRGADEAFAEALRRSPGEPYATLMRGAIASARGRRREAVVLLREAVAQAPRDRLAVAALRAARDGRVDLVLLQEELRRRAS